MDETVSERDRRVLKGGWGGSWKRDRERGERERRERRREKRIQRYLFASDIEMHTGICLGDVPIIPCSKK